MNDTESINGKSDRNADKSAKGNQNKDTLIRKEIYSKQALRFSIFLFFMVLLFDYADQSLTAPLVNTLLTDFFNDTHNVFALGVITFTFTILSAISMIVAGILADIHSRKIICFTGSLIYSTFAILTYFTPHGLTGYHFYFVTRAFNGLGIGAIVPTIFSLVGDLVPKERRSTSFSYITIAMLIGQMMGLAIASMYTTEWRSIYLILGLSNLGVTFLILTIKEPKRGSAEEELKDVILEGAEYNFKWRKEDLKELWANKSNFWLVVNFIDTFPGSIIIFLIFKYMEDLHNMKEEPVTIMIFLVAIFGAIGTYVFGRLGDVIFKKDRRGKVAVALFCNIFPIIFIIIFLELKFWLPDNATLGDVFQNRGALTAIIMIVITMFINQGVGPNWYSSLTDINLPEHRGTMISFASFMDMIGNAVGPLIGSYIATKLDITAAMWSANIFWIINVLLWVPVFFYIEKDLDRMHNILEERAEELKKSA